MVVGWRSFQCSDFQSITACKCKILCLMDADILATTLVTWNCRMPSCWGTPISFVALCCFPHPYSTWLSCFEDGVEPAPAPRFCRQLIHPIHPHTDLLGIQAPHWFTNWTGTSSLLPALWLSSPEVSWQSWVGIMSQQLLIDGEIRFAYQRN